MALATAVSAKTGAWNYNGMKHGDSIEGEYLLQFSEAAASASNMVNQIAEVTGANVQYESSNSKIFGLRGVTAEALAKLMSLPGVKAVTPNQVVTIFGDDTVIDQASCAARESESWGLARTTNVEFDDSSRHNFNDDRCGRGVQLHVLDTGVDFAHTDFNYLVAQNLTAEGDFTLEGDFDGHGHGTHVASTAAGLNYGFATCSQVVSLKVLTASGAGNLFGILGALEIGEEEARAGNNVVVNMSLGALVNPILNDAATAVANAGVWLIAAAGNDNGDAGFASPASAPGVWTVGSSDVNDVRSVFSNFGSVVDIFAPGTDIKAACPLEDDTNMPVPQCGQIAGRPGQTCEMVDGVEHCYAVISGTSMACPHAAGVAAVLWSENAELTNFQMSRMLEGMALEDALTNVPADTVNRLLQMPCVE
jgi:subtilisin family serine protease